MLGIPFETRKTFKETIKLNKKADIQYPNIGFFYPFEGTKLREISIKEGFFSPEDEEKTAIYRHDRPALRFQNLNSKELIEMRNTFVLYVKLPDCYEPFVERSEKQDELGIELRRKLLEIYDKTVFANDGWYVDDGFKYEYLNELNKISKNAQTITK